MPVLDARDVSKAFRGEPVLREVSLSLEPDRRYGLVGPNGGGKTTLARILAGDLAPDDGAITRQKALRTVYLPQRPSLTPGRTVREEALSAFDDLRAMEEELRELEERMARPEEPPERRDSALRRHGELAEVFRMRGGWDRERRLESALDGLGVPPEVRDRDVATLSGGQATRVAIARSLLMEPDLLILDEPTNHLDVDACEWLEGEILSRAATFLLVSHDRWFLDRAVEETLELERGRLFRYPGGYGKFVTLRAERREQERKAFEKQAGHIRKEEEFIRRNIAAQRVAMARGKRKRLSRLERLSAPVAEGARMALPEGEEDRAASDVVVLEAATARLGETDLLGGLTLRLPRGQKLGVVGPNGVGKTTLLRLLTGELRPSAGRVHLGRGVRLAYLAQGPQAGGLAGTVLDVMWRAMPGATGFEVRSWLGRFLFSGDEVEKDVAHLSGGEAARLALALLFIDRPNLLILDEPTNHLDIPGREALEEALAEFPGTVILVSHDRALLEGVADRVLEIRPDGWLLTLGGWTEHLEERRRRPAPAAPRPQRGGRSADRERGEAPPRPGKVRNPFRFARLEEEIIATEERIEELRALLADEAVWRDPERLRAVKAELPVKEERLAELDAEWEEWVG